MVVGDPTGRRRRPGSGRATVAGPRPALVACIVLSFAGCLTILTGIAVTNEPEYSNYSVNVAWAAMIGYVLGLAATSRIDAEPEMLYVINTVFVHEVPRSRVLAATVDPGLEIELADGGKVRSDAYQGSLLQSLWPTRRYRAAARHINVWRRRPREMSGDVPDGPRHARRRLRIGVVYGLVAAAVLSQLWAVAIWLLREPLLPVFVAIGDAVF